MAGVNKDLLVLYNDGVTQVVMNRFPYNNGHLLIAPVRHFGEMKEFEAGELGAVFDLVRRATLWLDKSYAPHGYNVGMNLGKTAGAGLPGHLHIHVVPRWSGDINFMPVVGETKVMSEGLEASWTRIRAAMEEMGEG